MSNKNRRQARNNLAPADQGGTVVNTDNGAAGVAPSGEVGDSGQPEGDAPTQDDTGTEGEQPQPEQSTELVVQPDQQPEGEQGTESQPQPEAADPFADVPVTKIGDDVEFADFSEVAGNDPFKYAAVHAAAVADRMPTVKGWKHERAMLTLGSSRKEFKPGSVYGTIQAIVKAAGRAGIPAYVVATKVRQLQIGNKRSKYCTALPPVGWAEGWINTAITKAIAGVHPTKEAPALRSTVTEGEAAANAAEGQIKADIAKAA